MLVARNTKSQIEFSNMFKNRLVHKTYLAVVKGVTKQDGKIDFPIGRHPIERHKMSHLGIESRDALTFYKTIHRYKNASLIAARIITGRTHQIRVHFAAIGHGLLGDGTYGFQTPLITRQALHAWKINFEFKGKTYNYLKHVPADITSLLTALNKP
jgi:23S rRNA pseudouridine1911/1915/1917 synthase